MPAYSLNLIVTGLCPLFLAKGATPTPTFERAAFGFIHHPPHIPTLTVNGSNLGLWLEGLVLLRVFDEFGNRKRGLSIRPDNANSNKLDAFARIIDLEGAAFHNRSLPRNHSALKSHLEFDYGEIYTNRLTPFPIEFERQGQTTQPQYFAEEIGILVVLQENEYATLKFPREGILLTFKNMNFDVYLDNTCRRIGQGCEDTPDGNDFALAYEVLNIPVPERFKARAVSPFSEIPSPGVFFSPAPRICMPVALSQSFALPLEGDYLT